MSLEFDDGTLRFLIAKYILDNSLKYQSDKELTDLRIYSFNPLFLLDYSLEHAYLDHVEKILDLKTPKDILNLLIQKDWIIVNQLKTKIGEESYNDLFNLNLKEFFMKEILVKNKDK